MAGVPLILLCWTFIAGWIVGVTMGSRATERQLRELKRSIARWGRRQDEPDPWSRRHEID